MAAKKKKFTAGDWVVVGAGLCILAYAWQEDWIQTGISYADSAINPQDFTGDDSGSSSGVSGLRGSAATQVLPGRRIGRGRF